MELKIIRTRLKKVNFDRIFKKLDASTKKITIRIAIHTKIVNITSTDKPEQAIIDSKITYSVEHFGAFDFDLQIIVKSDNLNEIIDFWNSDKENLPKEVMTKVDNTMFYFTVPLTLLISERAGIPPPIPPISMSKPDTKPKKKSKPVKQKK